MHKVRCPHGAAAAQPGAARRAAMRAHGGQTRLGRRPGNLLLTKRSAAT